MDNFHEALFALFYFMLTGIVREEKKTVAKIEEKKNN